MKHREKQIKELTTFESLSNRYSKVLPDYEFFQYKKTDCISFMHDEVPYSFSHSINVFVTSDVEEQLNEKLEHSLKHFNLTIERHHEMVKSIYQLCMNIYDEDIWVMIGGGCQLQVFFGNSEGYIGTLYLSMDSKKYKEEDLHASFTVNGANNDKYFIDTFNIENIHFNSHKSIYGKDDEEAKIIEKVNIKVTNPIEIINYTLKKHGSMKGMFDNPLSILIHMFYSFGNGYSIVQNDKVSFITQDRSMEGDNESSLDIQEVLIENKKTYKKLKEGLNSDNYQHILEKINITNEEYIKIMDSLKTNIDSIEEKFNFEANKLELKSLDDLEEFNLDVNNVYWENLESIVSNYSIVAKLPNNLSQDWQKAFDILTKKMNEINQEKIQKVQKVLISKYK